MNICFQTFMYRIVCIPLLVFLFNSCDEKIINFVPGPEDGLNFENKSFNLSVEQSSFTNTPKYISQDLGPLLYAGSIMESGQTSSALFQINSQILEGYNLCSENEDIENRGDIKFRLAVHTEIWDQEHLTLYYYNNDIDFSEDTINNHDSSNIENITSMIKSGGDLLETEVGEQESGRYILTSTLLNIDECTFENNQEDCVDSEYNECSWNENECSNSNSDISAFITWDNLCNLDNSSNYFYILLEYANPDDFIHIYSSDIVSSEPILSLVSPGMVDVPSLMVSYEKKSEMTILNSRFNINHNIGYTSLNIDDIMYSDNLYNWKFSCNSNTDLESCENYEYCTWNTEDSENPKCLWSDVESDHNIIIANTNSTLDNFGTLYGLQMDNSNQAIYQGSNLDEPATFTIDIELDTNVPSDSLIFIFTKASFNYGNDNINQHECNWNGNACSNDVVDNGEILDDTGLDGCKDEFESGDIKLEFDLENCFPYTWSEEDGCYFDYNNDEIYLLCVDNEENSGYNADGTENNDEFDCDLDNDGNCEENGRSEYWQDLGLDGADDDYETGCRLSGYNHGAGYTGDADETYIELINGNVDFYETEYTLKNGVEIRLCGQQYWDNPVDGKECRVCSIDDPNGDNYNSDPGEDNHPLGGEGNGEYDIGEPFLDFGIDQIENFPFDDTGTEGNETWDLGEQFFDTGIDSTFTGDEEGYCLECRQGNDLKDRILDSNGDELFSEYRDYGFDDCPNEYETGNSENPCDESIDNFYSIDKAGYLDLNRDDINEDPNGDNWHSVNNPEGLEGNQSYECDPNVGCEGLDENITLDASMLDGYLVNLGSNLYPYGLDGTEDYLQPTASGLEKVTLWISKIEQNEEGSYKLTISMSSQVDINSFEIQLYHNKKSSLEMLPTIITKQLSPFKYENTEDYDDVQFNGTTSFLEDSEKYIKDVSLYPFSPLSNISSDDNLISYDYGMEAKLYFDGLNDFLSNNDETAFISHEQTHLFIYIDTSFDRYPITDEGLFLKISGNIGNILVEDFIDPIPIKIDSNTDSRIKIRIGRLVDELLLNSDELSDDIENANITLSLDSYTHVEYTEQITGQYFHQINPTTYSNFSILKLSNEELPHINIFYSE